MIAPYFDGYIRHGIQFGNALAQPILLEEVCSFSVAKIARADRKGAREAGRRSEVAGGKLVVIVVAFHGEEMARKGEKGGGGRIKPRHFPINALIKSSRCLASGGPGEKRRALKIAWRWRGAARQPVPQQSRLLPRFVGRSVIAFLRRRNCRPLVFRCSGALSFPARPSTRNSTASDRRTITGVIGRLIGAVFALWRSIANDCSRKGNHRV